MSNSNPQRYGYFDSQVDLLQVVGEPNRRVGALAELPDGLVLAVVEDIA